MIEAYLLENLKAFYEYGTVSAAAEHLNMSQPSVSRSMKKLEEHLGVTLFERRKNRLVLNATGKLAAEYAIDIIKHAEDIENRIRLFDRKLHVIRIAGASPCPLIILYRTVFEKYPKKEVSWEYSTNPEMIEGLLSSRYSLVLLDRDISDDTFCSVPYMEERLYISIPVGHPAAGRSSVSFADLNGTSALIYANTGVWKELIRSRMPDTSLISLENMEAVTELLYSSTTPIFCSDIALLVEPLLAENRVCIPFSDPDASIHFYLTCLSHDREAFEPLLDASAKRPQP